ncbi:MAG: hypothetical protein RIR18_2431 [Pseudomonadota bacterium]|jgi:hypothetical protein
MYETAGMARTLENLAFAVRLKEALKRTSKKTETPSLLALQFNLHHPGERVTNQAAQKWLVGDNRPSFDKAQTLARMCDVSVEWLLHGIAVPKVPYLATPRQPYEAEVDEALLLTDERQLIVEFRLLSAHQKELVADLIGQLAMEKKVWGEKDGMLTGS